MVLATWCGRSECENTIKARTTEEAAAQMEHEAAQLESDHQETGEKLTGAAKSLCTPFNQPHLVRAHPVLLA